MKEFKFTKEWQEYADSKVLDDLWDLYDAIIREVNKHIFDKEYLEFCKARDYIRDEIRTRP